MLEQFYTEFIYLLEDAVPGLFNNSELILFYLIVLAVFLFLLFWLYCGFFVLTDSSKRIKNNWIIFLSVLSGFLLGPLFLLVYIVFRPRQTFEEKFVSTLERRFFYDQASKVLVCHACGQYVTEGQVFCIHCGTQNRFACSNCGSLVDYDDNFCSKCGYNLQSEVFHHTAEIYDANSTKPGLNLSVHLSDFRDRLANRLINAAQSLLGKIDFLRNDFLGGAAGTKVSTVSDSCSKSKIDGNRSIKKRSGGKKLKKDGSKKKG